MTTKDGMAKGHSTLSIGLVKDGRILSNHMVHRRNVVLVDRTRQNVHQFHFPSSLVRWIHHSHSERKERDS